MASYKQKPLLTTQSTEQMSALSIMNYSKVVVQQISAYTILLLFADSSNYNLEHSFLIS